MSIISFYALHGVQTKETSKFINILIYNVKW